MGKFRTMSDVKRANREAGNYFFEPQTMSFFASAIETELMEGRYFITPEKDFTGRKRLYTVREVLEDGSIKTVGDFQGFPTLGDAVEYIQGPDSEVEEYQEP